MSGEPIMLLEVPTRHGTEHVAAYTTDTAGLVVHRSLGDPGWIVTHQRSGLLVGYVRERGAADALAIALGGAGDWTVSGQAIRADPEMRSAARTILNELGADAYERLRDDRNAALEAR